MVDKEKKDSLSLNLDDFEAVIPIPVERIVVTSTTHLPGLELLEEEQKLIGFPGTQYVSSEKIGTHVTSNDAN